ncbi:seryl-tRNA synthetase [Patellaria atrata CBS 101060]|uniref:serine--tRNA ligase n=1 Tax=Patellaria atrata CBS 101060 TaxID=1346257 RepID=A0A9P4SD55_9PEZI|nr:seryl-tRNA synthetase [Patellaria atrata CBS 101060]
MHTSMRSYTRPSIAPKPYLDIKHIRQNPGLYAQNCIDRNYKAQSNHSWRILELFEQWKLCQEAGRGLRERSNALRAQLSSPSESSSTTRDSILQKSREVKGKLGTIEQKEKSLQDEMEYLALQLPNLSSVQTPTGNVPEVLGYINEPLKLESTGTDRICRSHVHIGSELRLMDFAGAATASGWGWYYLINEGALLEQALVQYALNVAMRRGWNVVSPPSIVYSHIAAACGFQPRDQHGEQQIYSIEQAEKDKAKPPLVLAGTAEIPLAGMKAGEYLEESELPLKTVGISRCYRAETGARGVDTKGLYRVHEFTKVELFAWTLPDLPSEEHFTTNDELHSTVVFDEIISIQKEILENLGLHCRILEMPSADLGASAVRKQDIEAFFPSRRAKDEGWGEVTSASICTDYQSRRLGTRVRFSKQCRKFDFPHTVNGTALAVPRVIAAILEKHWSENDKSVTIPEVLRPYMGGVEVIRKRKLS